MMASILPENKHQSGQYKFFLLLAVMYVVILLLTMFVENRVVEIGSIKILSGTLVIPLSYALSDIITEIYGYNEMRKLIWISVAALYTAALIIFCITHLPTGPSNAQNSAYTVVFKLFSKDIITYSIAAFISTFLNSYLLSKWKILTSGKIFWLRSLGATMVGEFIFILTWGFLGFSGQFPMHVLFELMLVSYICKVIYNIFAVIPSSLIVAILRKTEGRDCYDNEVNFNPFSLTTHTR